MLAAGGRQALRDVAAVVGVLFAHRQAQPTGCWLALLSLLALRSCVHGGPAGAPWWTSARIAGRASRLTAAKRGAFGAAAVRGGTVGATWTYTRTSRLLCVRLEDDLEVLYFMYYYCTRENSQKEIRAREWTQHSWLGGNTLPQISDRVDQMDCSPRVQSDSDDGGDDHCRRRLRRRLRCQCSFTVSTSARFNAAREAATLGGKYRGNPAIKGQFSLQATHWHWNP